MFSLNELQRAADVVHQTIQPTLLNNWPILSRDMDCEVWVKHENHTPTTAFKVRGGIHYLHKVTQIPKRPHGLISATRGNHGQSLSFAGARSGIPITIVVPEGNSKDQNRAIQAWGGNLIIHGKDFEAARKYSLDLQQSSGYEPVPPFCRDLVLGVATYALEIFSNLKDLDVVYVPVGMGSGICGLIKTRDLLGLKTEIVGVVSDGAPTFAQSFSAGKIIPTEAVNTIADGIATSSPMVEAFSIIKQGASRIVSVSDEGIKQAMLQYYQSTHNLAEGAAAAPLSALNKEKKVMRNKKVGLILTGGMIDITRFFDYVKPYL